MTVENCYEYRRWAENMMQEAKEANDAKSYWYLKGWLDEFDRVWRTGSCYPEYRGEWQRTVARMKELCRSL